MMCSVSLYLLEFSREFVDPYLIPNYVCILILIVCFEKKLSDKSNEVSNVTNISNFTLTL